MMKRLALFAALSALGSFSATASVTLPPSNGVSICDPLNPLNCLAPSSGGQVTVNGSVASTPQSFLYAHISTDATTVVKTGTGVLHTLTVNNIGTVSSTTTVYDNTSASAPAIAVINTLAGQISYLYDVAFNTGLTIVTTGTVAPDVTVSYR